MSKLLITLGDSFTHGVGCYEPELLIKYTNNEISIPEMYIKSGDRFMKYGWPPRLAKNLNYELINLGLGGSSNSGMAKSFIKNEFEKLREVYENVIVILLISDPIRFSFYQYGNIVSINSSSDLVTHKELYDAYVRFINLPDVDCTLETVFYIKSIESFCKANNYHFFYGSAYTNIDEISRFYKTNQNLHKYLYKNAPQYMMQLIDESSLAICGHPNENGYAMISDSIYQVLTENFNNIL
jgi:hypothetical protein